MYQIHEQFRARAAVLLCAATLLSPSPAAAQSVLQQSSSPTGAVSTAHPLATEAGTRMLEMGGNAADAAVAAAFAIAVVEPTMNSIGGRNQILVRLPDGTIRGIDGTTQAPRSYDPDRAPQADYGYAVIGVPGAAAGLLRLHAEHGSLPLATVAAPAIDYAENGFRVLPGEASRMASRAERSREFPATGAVYLRPDGTPWSPGELMTQPDYARTLRRIVEGGHHEFYRGEIAREIAADMRSHGGAVTFESLAEYEALDARIVRGSYRGYELVALDVPSAGAVSIQALQIMESFDPGKMTPAQWAAVAGQAIGLASRELDGLGTDTAAARATSKAWAARMSERISAPGHPRNGPGAPPPPPLRQDDAGHTTHLTTADANGMFVVLTQTLGPNMGSSVVTPGLGFLYASTLGGYLGRVEAGERARSFISPLLVLRDGQPILALGAAGGARIVSGVVQVVSRIIDGGMSLADALAAPRVHMSGDVLEAETTPGIGWTPSDLRLMSSLGLEVSANPREGAFSRVHAIHFDPATGTWTGVADPDWEGSAQAPRPMVPVGGAR